VSVNNHTLHINNQEFQYPGTMGAQTQWGSFYPSVCAPGPGPWPPVFAMPMAAPALQPPATEKIFMDPYSNM